MVASPTLTGRERLYYVPYVFIAASASIAALSAVIAAITNSCARVEKAKQRWQRGDMLEAGAADHLQLERSVKKAI